MPKTKKPQPKSYKDFVKIQAKLEGKKVEDLFEYRIPPKKLGNVKNCNGTFAVR